MIVIVQTLYLPIDPGCHTEGETSTPLRSPPENLMSYWTQTDSILSSYSFKNFSLGVHAPRIPRTGVLCMPSALHTLIYIYYSIKVSHPAINPVWQTALTTILLASGAHYELLLASTRLSLALCNVMGQAISWPHTYVQVVLELG